MRAQKEDKKQKHSFSAGSHGTVYLLGAIYLAYLLITFLRGAYKGGEDAPSLPLLIVGILVLGGGLVFLCLMAWKMSHVPPEPEEDTEAELLEDETDDEDQDEDETRDEPAEGEAEEQTEGF